MAGISLAANRIGFVKPVPTLSIRDAVAMIVGIVVGAGISAPSLVAANVTSEASALLLWVAGGAISLVGALCYAELTAATHIRAVTITISPELTASHFHFSLCGRALR